MGFMFNNPLSGDINSTLSCLFWSYFPLIICVKTVERKKDSKDQESINQAPHLTKDTNGKVTTSQLDITNESQEVSPFPAGDHKASINIHARKHNKNKTEIT